MRETASWSRIARVAPNERGVYAAQMRADGVQPGAVRRRIHPVAETLAMPLQLSGLVLDPGETDHDDRRPQVDRRCAAAERGCLGRIRTRSRRRPGVNVELDRLLQHPMVAITSDGLRVLAEDASAIGA